MILHALDSIDDKTQQLLSIFFYLNLKSGFVTKLSNN